MFPYSTRRCSSRPDDKEYNPSISSVRVRSINPYHGEYKGNSFQWDRIKVFTKDNADVVRALEPRDIDNFLNYGVSIRIAWALARAEFL